MSVGNCSSSPSINELFNNPWKQVKQKSFSITFILMSGASRREANSFTSYCCRILVYGNFRFKALLVWNRGSMLARSFWCFRVHGVTRKMVTVRYKKFAGFESRWKHYIISNCVQTTELKPTIYSLTSVLRFKNRLKISPLILASHMIALAFDLSHKSII